ncbi:putative photosynthetic complex assembly protein PuhE [Plastoroseomonas arctica]|uniref:DUF3623 domain-containing protein n=1 Tax=Plastoroseomonas arctica TaxID=1509237 RepID=A0AAF1K196_9PROT|nr:putative photosynthetic complex assembly protein PuhE [Plastoroseomonas arctica]MBR0654485.1 DUF3623 domain-containing protein [Plastoroseomonas arctica]
MAELLLPIIVTVFVWWFATGAILALDGLRGMALRRAMAVATGLLIIALIGLAQYAREESVAASYGGFLCGIAVWGWVEFAFLTGILTGPNQRVCPPGAEGFRRFRLAIVAILHHELALIALAGLVAIISVGQPNPIGLHTFLLLWAMRQSTKLNLFLGVRNFSEALLPAHLSHLASFFRRARMNLLFPVSITLATMVTAWLFHIAFAPDAAPHVTVGFVLLGTLGALAVLEHWFLVLPIPFEALWGWGSRLRTRLAARGASL